MLGRNPTAIELKPEDEQQLIEKLQGKAKAKKSDKGKVDQKKRKEMIEERIGYNPKAGTPN